MGGLFVDAARVVRFQAETFKGGGGGFGREGRACSRFRGAHGAEWGGVERDWF